MPNTSIDLEQSIPSSDKPRVLIVGAGFAGISLAKSLDPKYFQIVLIDRENYHQFQPLFYQVATSGLEPSAISFPVRKIFQNKKNFHFRLCELKKIDSINNCIDTSVGILKYDYLVLAMGAKTNFFGNSEIMEHAYPMKSVSEALQLRNRILENYEQAVTTTDDFLREALMQIVIVGGGPTGVEVSGALAEMKKYVLPKDFPELDFSKMKIKLIEASGKLLNGMSDNASKHAERYLKNLDVEVETDTLVKSYNGEFVVTENGEKIHSRTLIWAAGITGSPLPGLDEAKMERGNRVKTDEFSKISPYKNIYSIGDLSFVQTGHPQLAPVAIQQGKLLASNLKALQKGKNEKPFTYKDKGSMATVGRNLAVVDLPFFSFQGILAWFVWMAVHLMSILGVKNRLFVFLNWTWNYVTYDQSLRLIIKPKSY